MTSSVPIERLISNALCQRGASLSTAESCTGGLLGHRITNLAGASEFYEGGLIAYSNLVKEGDLGVKKETLEVHGAVSEETAREMALGANEKFGTDYSVSVTGIAGPGGGSKLKPVGLVYVGIAAGEEVTVREFKFIGDREAIKQQTSDAAFALLWEVIDEA